ncbi:MAG TPA: hypothetical protein VKG24_24425 [Pseudolabrys sp.]|nr:hypothetical protein [Pseudolabrys sp.]
MSPEIGALPEFWFRGARGIGLVAVHLSATLDGMWGRVGVGVFILAALIVWVLALLIMLGYQMPGLPPTSSPKLY